MTKKVFALSLSSLFLLPAISVAADDKAAAARNLVDTKCSVCHPAEKPLSANKNFEGWTSTVKRMQAKNPANLNDADAEAIIKYLAAVRGVK
ncbi:hypothetical protein FDZ71_16310 [bacterium]|nr:MAG: hypothetical protein FDZ71_16310 [bacterium]